MKINVNIISAFVNPTVNSGATGNPAGVVLDADALSQEQKLAIASQVGLSETAFVSQSNSADVKLEFFTPTKQIAHCGHATIATFSYLKQQGLVSGLHSSKETIDGNRNIRLGTESVYMEQLAPKYQSLSDFKMAVCSAIGLSENQTIGDPWLVNTGNSFIIIEVNTWADLVAIQTDLDAISELSSQYDAIGFYVFTQDTLGQAVSATARMFAPAYGIEEESATGMAAGPLACYLHDKLGLKKTLIQIEQGRAMSIPAPSLINVELDVDNHDVKGLMAGGQGKLVDTMQVEV